MSTIYAVVDLETTGTDVLKDQIIQFACTLVQDNQILHTFSTDINPGFAVPKNIQHLTGLTNRRLVKAPYFEDVALMIENILQDTVFVAHNVHFDYQFLSNTFVKYGYEALTIPAIDTVDLAQIFLPVQSSYRLNDLVTNLGISHENPHQADSDAKVTAELFLYLGQIIEDLPIKTLTQICQRCDLLSMQTGDFIKKCQELRQLQGKLATKTDDLELVEDIWVKKSRVHPTKSHHLASYPKTKKAKEKILGKSLSNEQAKLMNLIYQNRYSLKKEQLAEEVTIDVNRELSHPENIFLPLSYFTPDDFPVILGYESDIWWQNWQKVTSESIYSRLHYIHYYPDDQYIDLHQFSQMLSQIPDQKFTSILQMMILVWLTQTDTGSLVELGLYQQSHSFFQQVNCQSVDLNPDSYYLKRRALEMQCAQVVLFRQKDVLLANFDEVFQDFAYRQVIFEEVQYLLPLQKFNHRRVDIQNLQKLINQVLKAKKHPAIASILSLINDFQRQVFDQWVSLVSVKLINESEFVALPQSFQRQINQLLNYYEEFIAYISSSNNQEIDHEIINIVQQFQLLLAWFGDFQETTVHTWFLEKNHLLFIRYDFTNMIDTISTDAAKIFIGNHLSLPYQKNYFAEKLSLNNVKVKQLKEKERTFLPRIEVVQKGISIPEVTNEEFSQYIAKILMHEILNQQGSTLVLFSSKEVLRYVYEDLSETINQAGIELFALGQNTSLSKIKKRYEENDNQFVFLLNQYLDDSFLADFQFKRVILTRLPFHNPSEPLTLAYQKYLENLDIDAFQREALPTAGIRLARCLDLVANQPEAKLLILDKRLISTTYGKKLQKILPKPWEYEAKT
ncbi:exonuclease domain-containing protein [Enterococcus cecorum]|uniref:exonuclease domain-containing protein n=1 Tax=Enterococcus cecorum TaxID=44008 RepID=UPI003F9325C7